MIEQETNTTSQYNEAANQIKRLNEIWTDCRDSRERGNLNLYKQNLVSAEQELWRDAEKLDEKIKDHDYIKNLEAINLKIMTLNIHLATNIKIYYALLNLWLIKKERLLRKIQDLAGKGAVYIDPSDNEELD